MNHTPASVRHFLRSASAVTCLALAAAAQAGSSVTIVNGNMLFRQQAMPSASSNTWAYADMQANGTGSLDQLWSLWWYYRVAGDAQEYTFRNDVAPNAPTRISTGTAIVSDWPNVAGRGLFSSHLVESLVSTGPDRGYVQATMTLTNLTASPLTIDLFSLSDLEVGGSFSGFATNVAWGDLRSQYAEQQGVNGSGIEYYCPDADQVQVNVFGPSTPGALPFLLSNSTVDDLAGWNGTFGPGDNNGAFQWHRTIPASGQMTFTVYVAITSQRPIQSLYGNAGAGAPGLPTIQANERALVDPTNLVARSYSVDLAGALPASIALLASSLASAAIVLPDLEIYVDPSAFVTTVAAIDASGAASATVGLPNDPALNGVSVYHQYFVLDTAAVNGLLAWTPGLQQQIGSW